MLGNLSKWQKRTLPTASIALGLALTSASFFIPGESSGKNAAAVASVPRHGQDRVVRLYGPIDGEMADKIKGQLRELDDTDPGAPITMVITSKGGLVPAGLDIIDTMADLRSPVYTLCERWCTSMAAVITAAGDHSSAQPHAIMRFHEVELDNDDQLKGLERQHLLDILSERTGRPKEVWSEVLRQGAFLSPKRAQELGALDDVQEPQPREAAPTSPPCASPS